VLIAGINLYLLAHIVELLLGWPLWISLVIAAAIVLSYITLGGLSAAIYNEVLQFFVIVAALLPLTLIGLHRVGGVGGLIDKVTDAGNEDQLASWPGTDLTGFSSSFWSVIGIVFGLGFVLSFGYWTTNFVEVQRAMASKSMSAARRTPIIAAFPKTLIPMVIIIPGMIAGVLIPQLTTLKQTGAKAVGGITPNNALSLLMNEVLPNGILGVALAGLIASFMAGMAANVSSLNTVFTYDLWQDWLRPGRDDRYYLQVGRVVTVVGCVLAIGTAFIAGSFGNLMDYIQALFSFFNAPLFAIFILGLFWKRMTGTAGWTGLIAGAAAAIIIDTLGRTGVIKASSQAISFMGASAAFVVGCAVAGVVSMMTSPKPDAELVGLTWSLTDKHARSGRDDTEGTFWWQSPTTLGVIVLILVVIFYIIFA
jgi:SSS family solute:Na+ symporter